MAPFCFSPLFTGVDFTPWIHVCTRCIPTIWPCGSRVGSLDPISLRLRLEKVASAFDGVVNFVCHYGCNLVSYCSCFTDRISILAVFVSFSAEVPKTLQSKWQCSLFVLPCLRQTTLSTLCLKLFTCQDLKRSMARTPVSKETRNQRWHKKWRVY